MSSRKYQLYVDLGLEQSATMDEVARAYRKLALQFHPDRNPNGAETFKLISNAYAILSDPEKRAIYDRTGFMADHAMDMSDDVAKQQRSAELAQEVRVFFSTYAGSAEEAQDVKESYTKCKGNFKKMVTQYLLFDNDKASEVGRLLSLAKNLIKTKQVEETETWRLTSTPEVVKKLEKSMKREREEAEELLREMGGDSTSSASKQAPAGKAQGDLGALQLAMRQRQQASWNSMVQNLEDKYVKDKKSSAASRKRSGEADGSVPKKKAQRR